MATDLIASKKWIDRTAVFGRPRSTFLVALDKSIAQYERLGTKAAKDAVAKNLEALKKSKGTGDEWKRNERNRKDQAIEHLTALLNGGDTDKAKGEVREELQPALIHARLGVLYLFSKTQVDTDVFNVILEGGLAVMDGALSYAAGGVADGGWGFGSGGLGNEAAGIAQSTVTSVMIPGKIALAEGKGAMFSAQIPADTPPARRQTLKLQLEDLGRKVLLWLEDFARKVLGSLKEKFGNPDVSIAAVKNLLIVSVKAIMANAGFYLSAGIDMAKGVLNTIDASYSRFMAWQRGKNVDVLSGHPGVIVDSIKQAMNLSICEGLYTTLKGAANAATVSATWGAGMVVSIVIAVTEAVVKVIWRLVEIAHMKRFCREAGEHWKSKSETSGLHHQPFAFASWYKSYALHSPALAVLTLNTGICGDKMHFLKMFKDDGVAVSQSDFDRGCVFVDSLKAWGSDYLGKCGYDFSSDDKVVGPLLKFAKSHGDQGNAVWKTVLRIANA
jgi:hypothetical protein